MKNLICFLAVLLLTSCATTKPKYYVISRSALINAHDGKYAYLINRKVYKSNVCYAVGDTLYSIPTEFIRIWR